MKLEIPFENHKCGFVRAKFSFLKTIANLLKFRMKFFQNYLHFLNVVLVYYSDSLLYRRCDTTKVRAIIFWWDRLYPDYCKESART